MKQSIAILYMCAGRYDVFWKDFYISMEKYFLTDFCKEYYVFTDSEEVSKMNEPNIHVINQNDLKWPYITLMRFKMFCSVKEEIERLPYTFFFNANLLINEEITGEQILPQGSENLVVVKQPIEAKKRHSFLFPYDRNPKCSAYIPYNYGEVYAFGGLNGGRTKAFLEMSELLMKNIDMDDSKGILPRWYDESQLNRYILGRNDVKVLSVEYCWPEEQNDIGSVKIYIRDKKRYVDIDKIKVSRDKQLERSIKNAVIHRIKLMSAYCFALTDHLFRKKPNDIDHWI